MLRHEDAAAMLERWSAEVVTGALRETLATARGKLESSKGLPIPTVGDLLAAAEARLLADRSSLRPVINGTGVILHTNLGRAPLPETAVRAASSVAAGYSTLEYDLAEGERGDRYEHCADLVSRLTGAEASLVVNNNAAAVSLVINTLARGRDVVVARGELVEIGGGFRIPDVIERSGGFLSAVGTTNRTRVEDYARAITPSTGLLLKVHPSNYRIEGFVQETPLTDLVALGRSAGLPVLYDLGSGLLFEGAAPTLPEPSIRESVQGGADVVTWSGDKLLGGPQAGVIHGHPDLVDRLRENPLLRAFRVDKMTLAALEATLRLYLSPRLAAAQVPVMRMLTESVEDVEARAQKALASLSPAVARHVSVVAMSSVLGGGTTPGFAIPSAGWAVAGSPDEIDAALRAQDPPIVGRIEEGRFLIDFRTVLDAQEILVAGAVEQLAADAEGSL